jgi:hypothetical protein
MEAMALKVREVNIEGNQSELATMANKAVAKALAEQFMLGRKGEKVFQMEQRQKAQVEFEVLAAEMTPEVRAEFKRQFLRELAAAEEQEEDVDTQQYLNKLAKEKPANDTTYKLEKKLEYSVPETTDDLIPKTRSEYVFSFKAQQRRTARATLEMCRTVYEAEQTLREDEFVAFCKDVGYEDTSSTIRKFSVIGKVFPRLIDYAESLPVAWTNIYLLTQIPADDFERCIKEGFAFNKLSGGELKALVDKTKDVNNVTSPFKKDKKAMAYPVAKVLFTKLPDDTDFRLLQKALEEVQARLPVKFQLIGEQANLFKARSVQRYEKVKQEDKKTAVQPAEWDYGSAANEVHVSK